MGAAYVVVTSLYALGLLLVLAIGRPGCAHIASPTSAARPDLQRLHQVRPSHWRDLAEGLLLVGLKPPLLAAILLAVLVNLFAFPLSNQLLPYVARKVYGVDETGLGYLVASFAVGALLGSMTVSVRGFAPGRTMIASCVAWFLCLLVFVQMQTIWSGATALVLAGFAQSLCMVTLAVVLLGIAGEKFGGRIMGVRMLAIYGLPLGALAGGALIDVIGFRATGTLYALTGIALTFAIALRWGADLGRVSLENSP
jgi:predicted MFS family arabinose efflux permease